MTPSPHAQSDEPRGGFALPLLYNVVYCSRARPGVDEAAVGDIIAASRRSNPARGITGLLVFGSGVFFQWLEGPRDNVAALMDTLRGDPRHESIVLLSEVEEVRERLFPDWDMELVSPDSIRDVLVDAQSAATDERVAQALERLLSQVESETS